MPGTPLTSSGHLLPPSTVASGSVRSTLTLRAAATLLLDAPPVLVEQRVWGSRGYGLLLHLSS
jgi:hypothetical protein